MSEHQNTETMHRQWSRRLLWVMAFLAVIIVICIDGLWTTDTEICQKVAMRLADKVDVNGNLRPETPKEMDTHGIPVRAVYGRTYLGEFVMVTSAGADQVFDTDDDVWAKQNHMVTRETGRK